MPTPPIPGWNEPVATGTRSPIFKVAFWPSSARTCGLWITLVSLSFIKAVAVAGGIVIWKSVAFKLARVFRLMAFDDDDVVVVVVELEEELVLVLMLGCNCTVALVGGLMPSVCDLSRLTCMTAISINTSGF